MTASNPTVAPARRAPAPRQARAVATRAKLMAATFEALLDEGYTGTTTQEVCRRAGVSRGTLLHHFPTRHALVLAALEHVLMERVSEFRDAEMGAIAGSPVRLVGRLWETLQGPAFMVWLELTVAARTDAALVGPLQDVMRRFDALVEASFWELVPRERLASHVPHDGWRLVFAVLNGLALDRIYRSAAEVAPTVALLEGVLEGWMREAEAEASAWADASVDDSAGEGDDR